MTRARVKFSSVFVLTNKPTCTREHDNPLIKNDRALDGGLRKHYKCAMYIILRFLETTACFTNM